MDNGPLKKKISTISFHASLMAKSFILFTFFLIQERYFFIIFLTPTIGLSDQQDVQVGRVNNAIYTNGDSKNASNELKSSVPSIITVETSQESRNGGKENEPTSHVDTIQLNSRSKDGQSNAQQDEESNSKHKGKSI